MSENETLREKTLANTNAWQSVGDAVAQATTLYLREMEAYADYIQNLQQEFLEFYGSGLRLLTHAGKEQAAFLYRIRETSPTLGQVPNGTETISGMVNNIVKGTK